MTTKDKLMQTFNDTFKFAGNAIYAQEALEALNAFIFTNVVKAVLESCIVGGDFSSYETIIKVAKENWGIDL